MIRNHKSGIYMIRNKADDKVYIGQSYSLAIRWSAHKSDLRFNRHGNQHLQRAFNRDGIDNFEYIILEECSEEFRDEREKYWIEYYKSTDMTFGYNYEAGGNLNKKMPEESRKRMSEAKIGRPGTPHTEEEKQVRSKRMMGNTIWKGHTHSLETKQKMSESKRAIPTQEMIDAVKSGIIRKDFESKYANVRIWYRLRKEFGISGHPPISEENRRKMLEGLRRKKEGVSN